MSAFVSQLADPLLKYAMLCGSGVKAVAEASDGKPSGFFVIFVLTFQHLFNFNYLLIWCLSSVT